jgi:hypothetical protein
MVTRGILITVLTGATIGLPLLAGIFVFSEQWYATPITPLILLLAPGTVVGMFNLANSEFYWAVVILVQSVTYALGAVAIKAMLRRASH